jgi:AcrR family transcriptional regulator
MQNSERSSRLKKNSKPAQGKPAAGRPRNAKATQAVLKSAIELGMELGFDALTVEGVAARAGVGKATIYRRWPNVWSIIADAVLADIDEIAPLQQGATARESLHASMLLAARYFRGRRGPIMRALIGRAQMDETLLKALIEQWLLARRAVSREMVRRGIASGELRANLDVDIVLDALYGPLYHRLLLPYSGEQIALSDSYIDNLVATVFGGLERK